MILTKDVGKDKEEKEREGKRNRFSFTWAKKDMEERNTITKDLLMNRQILGYQEHRVTLQHTD